MKFIKILTRILSGLVFPNSLDRYTEDRFNGKRNTVSGYLMSAPMATVNRQLGRTANQSSLRVKERFQSIDFEITHDKLFKGIQGISRIVKGIDFRLKHNIIVEGIHLIIELIVNLIDDFLYADQKLKILPKKLYLPNRSLQFYNIYLRKGYIRHPYGEYMLFHT